MAKRRAVQHHYIMCGSYGKNTGHQYAGNHSGLGGYRTCETRLFRAFAVALTAVSLSAASFVPSLAGPATGITDEPAAHTASSGQARDAVPDAAAWGTWQQDKFGWWYRFADGTYPAACWLKIGGTWYYFRESGYMASGPLELNGVQYYLDSSGAMAENAWVEFREELYYFTADGSMAKSTWVDDVHYVDSEGRMVRDKWVDGVYIDEEGMGEHPDAHFFD